MNQMRIILVEQQKTEKRNLSSRTLTDVGRHMFIKVMML